MKPNDLLASKDKRLDTIRLIAIIIVTVFVAWLDLIPFSWLSNIVIIGTVFVCGYPIFKESFSALKKGRVNMELSMVIAIIASLLLFQLLPAIVITFFALMSEFIEGFIVQKGRKNIEMLYNQAPKKALLIITKEEEDVSKKKTSYIDFSHVKEILIDKIAVGDVVLVREGDTIPVDGSIVEGLSMVDQSSITGESIPIEKKINDFVYAGTLNINNKLVVRCEKISTETTYAKIIHLVEESESNKAPIQKLSDKMATRLIQFAIGLSVLTYILTQDLVSTLSVIVVAGACGLAVGTPIALLASNSKFAKNGIIVKGGIQIENISNVGTVVFDKTGTLTKGEPSVTEVISLSSKLESKNILECAAAAERNINHPLAKAIVEKATQDKIKFKEEDFEKIKIGNELLSNDSQAVTDNNNQNMHTIGRGSSVYYKGHLISVGNITFIKEQIKRAYFSNNFEHVDKKTPLKPLFDYNLSQDQHVENVSKNSYMLNKALTDSTTTVVVAMDTEIVGVIFLEDELRNETKGAIAKIKAMGLHTVMLTGDHETVANKIANESGIEEYHANMLPEDKVNKIRELVKKQKTTSKNKRAVMMIGDGINDAPSLAESDVGIAMGKTGTDIVIETADVILMTENLNKIPYLIKSSQRTLFTIRQNFFGTIFIDGLGFVLAFMGALNPLLAAFIHVASELVFMINSARLIRNT